MRYCADWFSTFVVSSTSSNSVHYEVTFLLGEGPRCTCPAWLHQSCKTWPVCKHVVHVMQHACLWSYQHGRGDVSRAGDDTLSPRNGSLRCAVHPTLACPGCEGPIVLAKLPQLAKETAK